MPLNDRQQRFVQAYLVDRDARRAALRAGYSARSAAAQARRLLASGKIAAAIAAGSRAPAARLEVTPERVIEEIARRALYDPTDLILTTDQALEGGPGGEGDPLAVTAEQLKTLPEDLRRAIDGWSRDRHGNLVVKLADKGKALEQLARHLGLFRESVDISVTDVSARIAAGRKRVARRPAERQRRREDGK